MRRLMLLLLVAVTASVLALSGCTPADDATSGDGTTTDGTTTDGAATDGDGQTDEAPGPSDGDGTSSDGSAALAWVDTPLTDAISGQAFRISDFAGQPVFVQGFAVW